VTYDRLMSENDIPASHRDLLEAPIPVAFATLGPGGYPQVTAIWAVLDGDTIVTSLAGIRQKLKNLEAHPKATVFVVDPANPYRTLEVRGDVTIEPDPDFVTLKKVLAAYGTDLESFDGPLEGRTTVTLRPTRVVAFGA
jgi:PPOX class probable F420-dependent enzyme